MVFLCGYTNSMSGSHEDEERKREIRIAEQSESVERSAKEISVPLYPLLSIMLRLELMLDHS